MKAKPRILCGTGVVLLLWLVFWTLRQSEKDPLYDGKPLSKHLESCQGFGIFCGGGFQGLLLEEPPEPRLHIDGVVSARDAILNVGTNALPMLVRMLGGGETRIDRGIRMMFQKFGLPQRFLRTNAVSPYWNQTRALVSFQTLGPRAAPAADRIVRLLNDPDTALCAIVAIMLIQPEREDQILSLTNVVRLRRADQTGASPDLLFSTALLALGSFGPRASNAIPFLIGNLGSTNERVQATAAVALARVGASAETVVPLIVNTLPKTDPTSQPGTRPIFLPTGSGVSEVMMKLWALEQFGPRARSALPMLSTLEQYRTRNIQEAAKRASAKIRKEKYLRPPSGP